MRRKARHVAAEQKNLTLDRPQQSRQRRINVDLPAPFAPSMATNSPESTLRLTPRNTGAPL
jgi:hypothetical protein